MSATAAWHRAYDDLEREHGHEPLTVEGTLPVDLAGTLYRCGPARFGVGVLATRTGSTATEP